MLHFLSKTKWQCIYSESKDWWPSIHILVTLPNNKNTTGRKFAKIKMGIFIIFSTKAMQIFWDYTSVFANVSTGEFIIFNFVKKIRHGLLRNKDTGHVAEHLDSWDELRTTVSRDEQRKLMLMLKFWHSHHHKLTWDKMGTFSLCVLGSLLKLSEIRLKYWVWWREPKHYLVALHAHDARGGKKIDPCIQYKTNCNNCQTCAGQNLEFMKSFICCHENSFRST